MALVLPKPELSAFNAHDIPVLTDDALASSVGVRVAFTGRAGGVSTGPYASLNLGSNVDDDPDDILANRALLAKAFGIDPDQMIVPNQVHGDRIVTVSHNDAGSIGLARAQSDEGADGLLVETVDVAALLCFADCTPVVIVSPTGRFAVVHAGWRGTVAGIAGKAVRELTWLDEQSGVTATASGMNVYIGPHIHVECFETGPEVSGIFAEKFGPACVEGDHVSMLRAIMQDVVGEGVDPARIVAVPYCTKCRPDLYFSYRADGECGRHGAFAVRLGTAEST